MLQIRHKPEKTLSNLLHSKSAHTVGLSPLLQKHFCSLILLVCIYRLYITFMMNTYNLPI